MGWKISWIGFHGLTKAEVLDTLGATDTGEWDEANDAPVSGAELPGGWYILFSNDFDFVSGSRLKVLSSRSQIVACQLHEGVMVSVAYGYVQGEPKWAVVHDSDRGIWDLTVSGSPPPGLPEILDRLRAEQTAAGGDGADVDFIFDVPVEVAAAVSGFRHDRWKYDWGEPRFTVLKLKGK